MTIKPTIAAALNRARNVLSEPVEPADIQAGWDEEHCRSWLKAVQSIERYVGGDHSERSFSIVRSLDSHGTDTMDHPRGQALMNLSAILRQNGIDHYA